MMLGPELPTGVHCTTGVERVPNGVDFVSGDEADAKGIIGSFSCGKWLRSENGKTSGSHLQTKAELLSDEYKMDHPRRGKAIIINNKTFEPELERKGYRERVGTDVDAEAMRMRLKRLHFEVEVHNDLNCSDMLSLMGNVAREDHSDADCFACVILSHGEEGVIFGIDESVEVKQLIEPLKNNNCKSLAGKPKFFFIQACRGNSLDDGADLNVHDAKRTFDELMDDDVSIRIPNEADFLIAYSSVPGYYSWRNTGKGSWFVQAIVQAFDLYGETMDIARIMTRVNRIVAFNFQSNTFPDSPSMHGKKQIPCITSMLTKEAFFRPKR